tara:strand:+ start:704 stop:1285 length:582 start_codon:yes stop_codon:yes gene_type:complete
MKTICVYAGSAIGNKESFSVAAKNLGHAIVNSGFSMVYGGGSRGLMGVVADAVLNKNGSVTGIITKQLDNIEVGHKELTTLEVVDTMHERKSRMAELSDSVISLPGGVGTWEEFYEALAWNQLGFYSKPIILLNIDNYYDDLYNFTTNSVKEGFLPQKTFEDLFLVDDIDEAISIVINFKKKDGKDWFKRLER